MAAAINDTDKRINDSYKVLMKGLSAGGKNELTDALSKLLQTDSEAADSAFYASFGAIPEDRTAEEIIADIRASRTFRS
jgi:hypothetical protein